MPETPEEFNKRAQKIMQEVQVIFEREKVTLVAQVNYGPAGIIPSITMVDITNQKPSPISLIKSKFIIP